MSILLLLGQHAQISRHKNKGNNDSNNNNSDNDNDSTKLLPLPWLWAADWYRPIDILKIRTTWLISFQARDQTNYRRAHPAPMSPTFTHSKLQNY